MTARQNADHTSPRFHPADTVSAALRTMISAFADAGIEDARSDARFLVRGALELDAAALALGRGGPLGVEAASKLDAFAKRRLTGEPVARILGNWEFWGLPLTLSASTLVPRPDTETLVEAALAHVGDRGRFLRILDLGTGSGCILLALLSALPLAWGIGIDRSPRALATARANACANGLDERAAFVASDWSAAVTGPFDLIVSNPPYIASATIATLAHEVRAHDPLLALDGGDDGLDCYRRILGDLVARPGLLAPDGALIVEIGFDQGDALRSMAVGEANMGIEIRRDLAGHERVALLRPCRDVFAIPPKPNGCVQEGEKSLVARGLRA